MWTRLRPLVPLAAAVAVLNLLLADAFHLRVLTLVLVWAVAAIGWNITAKAGQISLGHSAFTGLGAYTFALLYIHFGVSPWIGGVAGMAVAAMAAVLIGVPSFKLEGFYFTLATIAYPLILLLLFSYLELGELSVPFQPDRPWFAMQFRDQRMYVWIALGLLAAALVVQAAIERSRFGYYLRAIRDNEILAEAVGVRAARWKLAALAVSAAMTAAMAVVWVNGVLLVVTAEQVFGVIVVIEMLSLVFVGGIASMWGPVVGAVLLVPLASVLDDLVGDQVPGAESLVYGLALVLVALFIPEGIVWRAVRWWRQRRGVVASPVAATDTEDGRVPTLDVAPPRGREESVSTDRSTSNPLLSARGITKAFGGLRALDGVDLTIIEGEMVGIIGPNGAGKTTLFNALTGYLRPDRGTVRLRDADLTGLGPPDRYVAGVSRTFQVPQGFHRMTARENVLVAAMGARVDDPDTAADDALRRVGLVHVADVELASLTTLEIKLLEIGRAIVSSPVVLLVDEPLAGLNADERDTLLGLLRAVGKERGTTVVVIEHSVKSLLRYVDWMVALDTGRVLVQGRPADVVADPTVIESYLGRRWSTDADDHGPVRLV